jgi:hypothetical protein
LTAAITGLSDFDVFPPLSRRSLTAGVTLEIRTGTEGLFLDPFSFENRSSENQATDIRIVTHEAHNIQKLQIHLLIHRIHSLGPIQPDCGNTPFCEYLNTLVVHVSSAEIKLIIVIPAVAGSKGEIKRFVIGDL